MEEENLLGLVEISKKEAQVILEAGYLYLEMGQPDKAEEVFSGAQALLPRSEVPHLGLGQFYFSQGRYQEAVQRYRKAVELNPDSAAAHAFLGESLLFAGEKAEALKELDLAIAKDEEEGSAAVMAAGLKELHQQGAIN